MLFFAHAGHWLVSLSYCAPMLVLFGLIGVGKLRDRRAAAESARDEDS